MPKKWFMCPDGETIEIASCLEKCRMGHRCAPKPYLEMAGEWRPWSGKASVTMLDRCLRMTWLSQRVDFCESPDRSAFRIIGTRGHSKLESHAEEGTAETFMDIEGIRGVADLVEEEDGEYVLTDYKVVGSFAVAKMLGIGKVGEKPILDETGEPVLYVRGPKAGKAKTEDVYGIDPVKADVSDYQVQPNLYKIAWEATNPGKKIARLQIFAIVRDGGLYIAKSRGVQRNTYVVPIPILPEDEIKSWAQERRAEIEEAMASDVMPSVGTAKQTWDGAFCKGYCAMSEACRAAGDNPWLGEADE